MLHARNSMWVNSISVWRYCVSGEGGGVIWRNYEFGKLVPTECNVWSTAVKFLNKMRKLYLISIIFYFIRSILYSINNKIRFDWNTSLPHNNHPTHQALESRIVTHHTPTHHCEQWTSSQRNSLAPTTGTALFWEMSSCDCFVRNGMI